MRNLPFLFFLAILVIGCKQEKKYHDEKPNQINTIDNDDIKDVLAFQAELNEEFKNPDTSPLPDKYRKSFETLEFFEPDVNYVVMAKFVRTPEALPFLMPTTTERKSEEVVYGIAYFEINGKKHQLEVYQNKKLMLQEKYVDYLFLPFTDETNDNETYPGGRYIDLTIPNSDTILINFNKAYNPYCAYNKKYSCPIVPSVNALDIEIRAGVKDFKKEKN